MSLRPPPRLIKVVDDLDVPWMLTTEDDYKVILVHPDTLGTVLANVINDVSHERSVNTTLKSMLTSPTQSLPMPHGTGRPNVWKGPDYGTPWGN